MTEHFSKPIFVVAAVATLGMGVSAALAQTPSGCSGGQGESADRRQRSKPDPPNFEHRAISLNRRFVFY